MRLSTLSVALSLLVGALAQQKPLQVYLHPTPSSSGPDSPPTLSADQAKAVLAHHLGDTIEDFDEIPADESLWSHLMGMWAGEKVVGQGDKPRVVIIEGGVMPQGGYALSLEWIVTHIRCPPFEYRPIPFVLPQRGDVYTGAARPVPATCFPFPRGNLALDPRSP